jgi:hypothetical protein
VITGYSYPWDFLGDDRAAPRAASLGLDVVALAATYHATRVATPLHPTRRVTDIAHSAAYFRIRDDLWRGHRLQPRAAAPWVGHDSFKNAQRELSREGVVVDGWVVLTHDDDVAEDSRDLLVRNAFGETYLYALCPRHDDVRRYCRTLVQEALRDATVRGVVVEACGPMGIDHSSTHDKVSLAQWTPLERQLLSLCFCGACEVGLSESGVDAARLAHTVRDALDRGANSMEEALGDDVDAVVTYRVGLSTTLQHDVIEAAREVQPDARVTIHASANPWATGSFPASTSSTLALAASAVANCWDADNAERELSALGALTQELGAYLRLDHDRPELDNDLARYRELGVSDLHLYHLGLLSTSSAQNAARLISTWTSHVDAVTMDRVEESLNDG